MVNVVHRKPIYKPETCFAVFHEKGEKRISLRAEWEVLAETGGTAETFDAAVSSSREVSRFRRMECATARSRPREGRNSYASSSLTNVVRCPFRRHSVGINGGALLLAHLERMAFAQIPLPSTSTGDLQC